MSEVYSKPVDELNKEEAQIEHVFQKAVADSSAAYTERAGDILYTPSTQCNDGDKCKEIT